MELAAAAIDFSHYSHFPDEYSNEYMEMASGSDDEDLNSEEHELDLQEQLLRGAEYEDALECDEDVDEDYAMDDAYWQSECSSRTSSSRVEERGGGSSGMESNYCTEESSQDSRDSPLRAARKRGASYDDDQESSEMVDRKRVRGGGMKGAPILVASSTEMLRIRFPFQSLSLRLSDFLCLQEGDYLNDTIIDFYLNHIVEHLLPDEPDRRVTVLPSVFWHNLSLRQSSLPDEVEKMSEKEKDRARFEDILDFVADFELREVDYVVIPVNEWEHWSLIMVCHPYTEHSRIVCFDSQMAADPNDLLSAAQIVARFFKYAGEKATEAGILPSTSSSASSDSSSLVLGMETTIVPPILPSNLQQQDNHYDCGLYVLEYARRFLLNPPSKMESLDFLAEYPDFCVAEKRCEIQRVILSLCANRPVWEKVVQLIEPVSLFNQL